MFKIARPARPLEKKIAIPVTFTALYSASELAIEIITTKLATPVSAMRSLLNMKAGER